MNTSTAEPLILLINIIRRFYRMHMIDIEAFVIKKETSKPHHKVW